MASASIAVSQQQPRPDPGHLLDRGGQICAAGEHLVHLGAQPLAGRYSLRHGRGLLPRDLIVFEGNLRPSSFTPELRRDPARWLCFDRDAVTIEVNLSGERHDHTAIEELLLASSDGVALGADGLVLPGRSVAIVPR